MSTEIVHQIGYWWKAQRNQWGFVDHWLWSNRQMHSYIGMIVHFISNEKLHNAMLTYRRSKGWKHCNPVERNSHQFWIY